MPVRERRPERLHEWIAGELTRDVVDGDVPAGALLPSEAELCGRFEASRTAVREALKVLESKGLIDIEHGRGSRVRPAEHWNIFDGLVIQALRDSPAMAELLNDLLRVREMVEVQAVALAASAARPEDVEALNACVEEMASALKDPDAYFRLDVRFHEAIFSATGNLVLVRLVEPVKELLLTARRHVIGVMSEANLRKSLDGHVRIAAAIAEGDPEAARAAMIDHLGQTEEELEIATEAKFAWVNARSDDSRADDSSALSRGRRAH